MANISLNRLKLKIFLCVLMLGASASAASACEPCLNEKSLKLEQSIARADLIVVGHRINYRPKTELTEGDTPQRIEVQVKRVLRGGVKENQIAVRSYSGMCPYGVVLEDEAEYVLLLRGGGDEIYDAVDRCGVKAMRVAGGKEENVTLDPHEREYLPLAQLLRDYIAPPEYRRVVELLQYLKDGGEGDSGSGFDASRGGNWQADKLLSFISGNGLTLYDVNGKRTRRLTRGQLSSALSRRGDPASVRFSHLGHIYAQPYPQYSTLRYEARPGGVVVEMSGWYRLTFGREDGALKLTKLEYLMTEGD
jgi:hypothetical protein